MPKERLTGRVVLPGDPEYDAARTNYNLRFDAHPRAIVFCRTPRDVSNAVRWARKNKAPIAVRSGRHAYEGSSLGEGIVIDVAGMDRITIDPRRGLAEVGAGVTLLSLYEALWAHGLTIPGGSCPTVGIAGLTLAGGFGLLSRALGLTCDNLVSLRMIDATGELVTAGEAHHADLLWASRGGGGGTFGIVTSFTFRARPIGRVATYRAEWRWAELPAVLDAWQRWAPFTDDRLTSILKLHPARADRVSSVGLFLGPASELLPLLDALRIPRGLLRLQVDEIPYIEAARAYAGVDPHGRRWKAHGHADRSTRFKNTSDYARAPLGPVGTSTICNFLARAPNEDAMLQLDAYGGAVNRVPVDATAFPHRAGTLYSLQYQTYWSRPAEDDENIAWALGFRAAMQPFVSGEAYAGYADRAIVDWPRAYFGPNWERLVAVKTKYDPDDVFHHAQSVPPAPPCPLAAIEAVDKAGG
jgi:FAD/FMN-containing dehydrogenase